MVLRSAAALAVLSAAGLASAGTATVYTDLASFMAQLDPGSYTNDFTGIPTGPVASMDFGPVNGFAYTVSTQPGALSGLFNDVGIVSTDNATDSLYVTFTGAPVTAVGGNFWGTDVSFFPNGATINISLSDGTNVSYASTGPSDFRGFISDVAISSIQIDASDSLGNSWATMDNLVVGAIPAPGAAAVLGLAGIAGLRRRR